MSNLADIYGGSRNEDMATSTPYLTGGGYRTEDEACRHFDALSTKWTGRWFDIYRECRGQVIQPKIGAMQPAARIDRLLVPREGTPIQCGAIGVEIKKTGVKLGPVICQCQDYLRCIFRCQNGVNVAINAVFVFMVDEYPLGNVASIMEQSRVGAIDVKTGAVRFRIGQTVLAFRGAELVNTSESKAGFKMGSR